MPPADRTGGGNAAMDEEDAIEASDDEGFGGMPAPLPAAAFKRPAPMSARQQSVSCNVIQNFTPINDISIAAAASERPAPMSARQQSVCYLFWTLCSTSSLTACWLAWGLSCPEIYRYLCRLQPARRKAKTEKKASKPEVKTKNIASFFKSAASLGVVLHSS